MANNINTLVSSNNGVQSGATIVGRNNDKTISNLNKASSIYSGSFRQRTTQASNESLNRTASLYSGSRRSMYDDNNNTSNSSAVTLPEPDENLFNEFMATVAPYVKMSDEEKNYYYQISSSISANGGDASVWAQDFLSTNAIANVLGVSRSEVNQNRSQMLNYYLGIEGDKPLDFTTGATLINSINQGLRQQEEAGLQEDLINLYKKGYDDNSPEVQQTVKQILQKEQEMSYFEDSNPRMWTTEWAKNSLSQLAYMGVGTLTGTLGGVVGGLIGNTVFGLAGGVKGFQIGSGLARFLTYDKQFEASAFWNMKQAGVSTETALKYSNIDGFINGLNEAFLDVGYSQVMGGVGKLAGVADLGGKIVPTIVSRVAKDGTLAGWLGRLLLYMGLDATGEFVQESTQSLTSSALQAIAEATDGMNYSSSVKEALSSAWEEGIQGFATGLFFSGFGSGINVLDIKKTSKLKNNSLHSYSQEAYVNNQENRNLVKSLKLGGSELSEDNVTNLLKKLYDSTQKVRDDIKNGIRKDLFEQLKTIDGSLNENVLDGVDITTNEIKDVDGNVISGKKTEVKRKSDGSTYFVVDKEEDGTEDGKEHYTMRIANPNVVGSSRLGEIYVDAKTAEYNNELLNAVKTSPKALSMEQAGAISFTLDGETKTLTIESVNVQDDNASLKEQAIRDLMSMYSDYSIEWNNRSQSDNAVFSSIESSNPRNTSTNTYGLNYSDNSKTTEEQNDRAYVRRWLGSSFSENASENDFMATILQGAAKARGLSGQEFIEKYFTEIRESENKDANVKGYTKTSRDELSKQVKATIYAGKSADPTTFLHELNHAIILMGDNRKEFTSIFNKVKGTKQFMSFVKKNMDILRYVVGKTDDKGVYVLENGNYVLDEAKLQSLFQDVNNWTRDDFEFEARLYEAYMRSGQTLNPTLTGFFRRVAETFRRIYTALRNGISSSNLNDEIVAYFDKLYGYDSSTGTTSVLNDSGELHDIGELRQEKDSRDELTFDEEGLLRYQSVRNYLYKKFGLQKNGNTEFLIHNKDQNTNYRLSKTSLNKMLSKKATDKSYINGFSTSEHNEAVSNVKELFENAILKTRESDKKNSPDMKDIERFEVDFSYNGEENRLYTALFTAKRYADSRVSNGLYSIELVGIKIAPSTGVENSTVVKLNHIRGFDEANNNVSFNDNIAPDSKSVKGDALTQTQDDISNLSAIEQFDAIKKQYYGTDEYMIAPNGKATNLTEEQWIQVRTPNFIKWFGDWINDPDNASKVVDENGETLVVYHGTPNAGFDTFTWDFDKQTDFDSKTGIGHNYGKAFFFTSDYEKAVGYSYRLKNDSEFMSIYNAKQELSKEAANAFNEGDTEKYNNLRQQIKYLREKLDFFYNREGILLLGSEVKSTVLSIKNPLIVDANGEYFFNVYDQYFTEARKNNNDGIIVKDVIDNPRGKARPMNVYIAFSPNQIKSATDNNGEFSTESDSILYQREDENDKPQKSSIGDYFVKRTPKEEVSSLLENASKDSYILNGGEPFSRENWDKTFKDFSADTTIGKVFLGQHQYEKLINKGRTLDWSLIKPTLENPSVILAETDENGNENGCYEFIKSFKENGETKWFYSVIVTKKDAGLFSISNRRTHRKQIENKMVKYLRAITASEISEERRNSVQEHPQSTAVLNYNNNLEPRIVKGLARTQVSESASNQEETTLFQTSTPSTFDSEIDNLTSNDIGKPNDTIVFATNTPKVFTELGLPDLSVEMYKDKLARGLFDSPNKNHGHNDTISQDIVKEINRKFADPIMIFDSTTKGSIVAVYDIPPQLVKKKSINLIMASIAENTQKPNSLIVNLITSMYGKDSDFSYINWIQKGLLRYIDDKKVGGLTVRLQLPSAFPPTNSNILTKTALVNKYGSSALFQVEKNTQSDLSDKLMQLAYHGSPNEIIGDLSTKYMGSGEGVQIHGWGLYFAQDENISKERYISRLAELKDEDILLFDGKEITISDYVNTFPLMEMASSWYEWKKELYNSLIDNVKRNDIIERETNAIKNEIKGYEKQIHLLRTILDNPSDDEARKELDDIPTGEDARRTIIDNENWITIYNQSLNLLSQIQKNPEKLSLSNPTRPSLFINGEEIKPSTDSAIAELYGTIIDYSLENNLIKKPEGEVSFSSGLNRKLEDKYYQEYFKTLFDEGKLIPMIEGMSNSPISDSFNIEDVLDVAKSINSVEVYAPTYGSLLTVDIPENEVLLDEEKRFSNQSEFVQKAIKRLFANEFGMDFNENWRGEGIYSAIQQQIAKKLQSPEDLPKQASLMLAKYGVEGITYVGETDGRCFVIFTDDAIKKVDSRLYQIGDSEWTETAKRIAYEASSLEDFFKKYREQVEDGNIELDDANVSQLLTSIYDEAESEAYDPTIEGYFDEEESSSIVDEDWSVEEVESPTEEESMASPSTTTSMSDEVPDWFDLTEEEIASLNKDAETTEKNTQELEKNISDIQKVVVDADLPKGLSLDHSRSLDTSSHARAIEFANILKGSKEATIEFLKALREVNNEFFYNNGAEYNEAVNEESYQAKTIRESAFNNFKNMSKFIQNLVYESRGSQYRNLDKITDRAWKIVAGQVSANPDVYMDLYSRASGNTSWSGENSIEARVLSEIGLTERDWNNLSYSKRKEYIQYIEDKDIRKKILTGDVKDVDLRGYIERTEKRAEAALSEAKALEESQKYIIDENKKTILKLGNESQNYQKQLLEIEKEKNEIQEKLERNVKSMENKLKSSNMDTSNTLVHADLLKKMTELNRREAQYQKALKMWQKGSSTVTQDDLTRIKGLIEDARAKIEELQKAEEITPEEAIKRLQNLYNAWKDAKTKETIDKLKDKYNVRLSNLRQTKNEAIVETRKRYMEIMKERETLRRIRSEKERLIKQIMKAPSANIAREEARQIKALQLLIDPAFRRGTIKALDGKVYTVAELKAMLTKNSDDPVIQTLTERQIERLTKTSLDEMTLSEVEDTYRYIKHLREEGLNKRRSEIIQRKAETQIIYNELTNALMESKNFADYGFEGTEDKKNRLNTKSGKVRNAWYQTLNMARKAQILDNNEKGTFYNLLIRKKRTLQAEEMKALSKRANLIQDTIKANNIDTDSLYKTWTMNLEDGRTVTFTTSELAYIYLSQYCQENREALAYGTFVSIDEKSTFQKGADSVIIGQGKSLIEARENKVNDDIRQLGDWRYNEALSLAKTVIEGDKGIYNLVKAIESDFNSSDFQRVIDLTRKIYNVDIKKEDYYLPLNRTDFLGKDPGEDIKNDLLNTVPGTRGVVDKGFTKERNKTISPLHQKAIKYDLFKVWTESVKKQEHFIAMQEYINQLNSLFVDGDKAKLLRSRIENTYGKTMLDNLDEYIKEVANPDAGALQQDPAKDILNAAKGNIYAAYLGFKLSSITNQLITSPAAFLGKVSPIRLASNLLQMIVHYKDISEKVFELSPFMKSRNFDLIAGEIKESAENLGLSKAQRGWNKVLEFGLKGLEFADQFSVVAGWKAIFDQELERLGGETEENIRTASAIADEYVYETQPLSDKSEIAPLFKNKSAFTNIMLQFQTSLNVVWNNLAYDTVQDFRKKNWRKAVGTVVGYAMAGSLLALAHGEFKPDDDDDEDEKLKKFWMKFGYSVLSQGVESIPIFSNVVDPIFKYIVTDEKPSYTSNMITPFPFIANASEATKYTVQAIREKDTEALTKALDKGADAFMLALGLPYSGLRELQAIQDVGIQALIGERK